MTGVGANPQLLDIGLWWCCKHQLACLFVSTSASCVNDEKQIFSPTGTTPATTGVVVTYNTLAAAGT
jgi:hypothetical protein